MQSSVNTCSRVQSSVCLFVRVRLFVRLSVRTCPFVCASVVCASVNSRLFVRRPLFVRLLLCVFFASVASIVRPSGFVRLLLCDCCSCVCSFMHVPPSGRASFRFGASVLFMHLLLVCLLIVRVRLSVRPFGCASVVRACPFGRASVCSCASVCALFRSCFYSIMRVSS